jgi:uncharacterized MAPEG superfamily protein
LTQSHQRVGHNFDIYCIAIPAGQPGCEFTKLAVAHFFAGENDVNGLYSIPYLSLMAAGILAYWPRFVAWRQMTRMDGGYDNNHPRAQQALLRGIGARAMAAHHNCLEGLPFFGLGVLAALQRAVEIHSVVALCVLFLMMRVVFIVSYLRDHPTLRSLAFMVGGGVCLVLYGLAACGTGNPP